MGLFSSFKILKKKLYIILYKTKKERKWNLARCTNQTHHLYWRDLMAANKSAQLTWGRAERGTVYHRNGR